MTISPALREAVKNINAMHGAGTVVFLGETTDYNVRRMPTGIPALDGVLLGGLPQSSIIEVYGEPMAGKSTLAYVIMAYVQRQGGTIAFVDAEHGLDDQWISHFGLDINSLAFSQPDTGEQALDAVNEFVRTADVDVVVVDSVSALVPRAELEGVEEEGMGDQKIGLQARLMSKEMRVLTASLKKRKSVVVFINQFTESIGLPQFGGGQLKTKGGRALKQYARVRLEVQRIKYIESDAAKKAGVINGRIGQHIEVKVMKSKVSPPYRKCELMLSYYTAEALAKMGIKRRKP